LSPQPRESPQQSLGRSPIPSATRSPQPFLGFTWRDRSPGGKGRVWAERTAEKSTALRQDDDETAKNRRKRGGREHRDARPGRERPFRRWSNYEFINPQEAFPTSLVVHVKNYASENYLSVETWQIISGCDEAYFLHSHVEKALNHYCPV